MTACHPVIEAGPDEPRSSAQESGDHLPTVALVGRPNTGKSTFLARASCRFVETSNAPGTTTNSAGDSEGVHDQGLNCASAQRLLAYASICPRSCAIKHSYHDVPMSGPEGWLLVRRPVGADPGADIKCYLSNFSHDRLGVSDPHG